MNNKPPNFPTWWIIAFPTIAFGWAGSRITSETFSLSNPGWGIITGAAVGLLVGILVYLDDMFSQRRDRKESLTDDMEVISNISATSRSRSNVLAVLMLIIPVVAALCIWQRQSFGLSHKASTAISFLTIFSTSVLCYIDGRQFRSLKPKSATGESIPFQPAMNFAGMLAMWVLCFPAYFIVRHRIGATNFIIPALLVTVLFMGSGLSNFYATPELPTVDAPEVVSLVVGILEKSPEVNAMKYDIGSIRIDNPIEILHDRLKQRRVAQAELNSNMGKEFIFYSVEWKDASNGVFSIQIIEKP